MSSSHDSSSSTDTRRGCGWPIIGCVLLAIVLAAIIAPITAFVLPLLAPKFHQAECQQNLKLIGLVLQSYRTEHEGKFPTSFADLGITHESDLGIFVCPESGDRVGPLESIAEWSSYEIGPYDGLGDPATSVICRDKKSFHETSGRNELFADGHVSFKRDAEAALP